MFEVLQPTHLLFILVVALLVFGPKRLPELGRAIGQSINSFKTGLSEDTAEKKSEHQNPAPEIPAGSVHAEEVRQTRPEESHPKQ